MEKSNEDYSRNSSSRNEAVDTGTLLLLYVITTGLNHQLRTPLSVFSNDLAYYRGLHTSKEDADAFEARAKRSYQKIINSLNTFRLPEYASPSSCTLRKILTLLQHNNVALKQIAGKHSLYCIPTLVVHAISLIDQSLTSLHETKIFWRLSSRGGDTQLRSALPGTGQQLETKLPLHLHFQKTSGSDSHIPALAELLLKTQGITTTIQASVDGNCCTISLPIANDTNTSVD